MRKFYLDSALYFRMPPVRDKISALITIINTVKYILIGEAKPTRKQASDVQIILCDSKRMKRIFYCVENKYISMSFPFNHINNKFYFKEVYVDNEVISHINSFLTCEQVSTSCDLSLDVLLGDDNLVVRQDVFFIFIGLLMFEDGYIRYDYDPKHENKFSHPVNHLDINYSTPATFKLGLKTSFFCTDFIGMLDNQKTRKIII